MFRATLRGSAAIFLLVTGAGVLVAADKKTFQSMDVFALQYADNPQVSPDGKRILYSRTFFDILKDRRRSNLWIINADGTGHEPLTTGNHGDGGARWSPDGKRIVYVSDSGGSPQLFCRWLESGRSAKLTQLTSAPAGPAWSPDGKWIAFAMQVTDPAKPFVELPAKPEGAEWAAPPKLIRKLNYRYDGIGYLTDAHFQLFIVPADGGAPRQLTEGPHDHFLPEGGGWTPDGKALVFSANRHLDSDFDPLDSEVYEVSLPDRHVRALTDRRGPDGSPAVSPDGRHIAFVGFDDRRQGFQVNRLYVMDRDGKHVRTLTSKLDRAVHSPAWAHDGKGLYFLNEERGSTKVGFASLDGDVKVVAQDVGGTYLGRPYASGAYSVANDTLVFTQTSPTQPAELAVLGPGESHARRITSLNEGLLGDRNLARAEEIWFESAHDGRKVQGWILKPPGFDAGKKHPLILEIHGGPFADYGERFAAELQLLAAAGYVVFYANPRGSTGYGEEFGNLIHHAYPGNDYDDLMAGVDAVIARGYVDKDNLFVTGGSGGGVLTCWIVGKTKRFRAAVSAYPVINWYSFVLTSDESLLFTRYWFPGLPWEQPEQYLKRSPLSLVGNVSTPTMLMTGEEDFRTPISEAEQYYKALKLRKVDAALVRVPGAGHNVSARPSHLIAKVAYILKWFETHRQNSPQSAQKKAGEKETTTDR
jgi:acylaminoacyl-peptidase